MRNTPEKTSVNIRVRVNGIRSIEIADFGPGVPETALTSLFQPFFRVDDAREHGLGGSGLGLSIADRAVHLHNETIHVKKTREAVAWSSR